MAWIAALTNRQPAQVIIVHAQMIDFGVVCQKIGDKWEALYGVRPGAKVELPSCFSLNDEAIETLDTFMEIQGL
jgi:hypothetical protein